MGGTCRKHVRHENYIHSLGLDGKTILKWTLKTQDESVWNEFRWFRRGSIARFL
jgi:hypothetical protein